MSGLIQGNKNKDKEKKKQQTRGLVQNKPIEFETKTEITELTEVKQKKRARSKSEINNQQVTIKIPKNLKTEINSLMTMTDTKYIYEMIDYAIQFYVENKLSTDEKKIYKFMTKQG